MDLVVEVKMVDETNAYGLGIDVSAGGDRGGVLLELGIDLERESISEVEIEASTEGKDVRDSVEVEECAGWIGVATVLVGNLSAAIEEVGVGVIAAVESRYFDAEENIFLGVDLAVVDGIGTANLGDGIEAVEGLET